MSGNTTFNVCIQNKKSFRSYQEVKGIHNINVKKNFPLTFELKGSSFL